MEDGQIGTVKIVDPDQKKRIIVQLYVLCTRLKYIWFPEHSIDERK